MNATQKLISARTSLVLDEPFFGALALGIELREDPGCKTAWTDGRSLGYDPKFIESLSHAQTCALIAHEVMHCAAGHPWRRDARGMKKWNLACDKAINTLLKDAAFTLPPDGYYAEGQEIGKSAEWIYARLLDPPPDGGEGGEGDGAGSDSQPNPLGEFRDAPAGGDPATGEAAPSEADWQQAVQQAAAAAKSRGKLPTALDRFAGEAAKSRVDWRSVLRRFITERAQADYSWSRPNRRYLASGLYLPSLESTELGEIAIAIDTSGSIDDVALKTARAELEAVIDECQPSAVSVYYADAEVARADRFERGEPLVWRPRGGGGTDFRPVFEACEHAESQAACLVYITDLDGHFPAQNDIPTLWVTESDRTAPFGETVRLS